MNLEYNVEKLSKDIEKWANTRIKEEKPIIDFITRLYIKKNQKRIEKVDLLLDYEATVDTDRYKSHTIDVLKPREVEEYIWDIKYDAKIHTPTLIVSLEEYTPPKEEVYKEYYEEFINNTEVSENDDKEFILRFEAYNKTYKKLYKIENNEFIFAEELPDDGKKFFPYFN